MRKWVLIFGLMVLAPAAFAGGEKFQINLLLSPTAEWLYFRNSLNAKLYNDLWGSKLSYNFGIEYKRFFDPSLSFSTGIMYMNKGFRNKIPSSSGAGDAGVTLGSAHIFAIPLYMNIHHDLARRVEMIYTGGLGVGYVASETVRNRYYTEEDVPNQGLLDVAEGTSNVNLFVDYYVGLHVGVGISAYLKSRIVLVVQPMYKYQLNNARDYFGQFASSDPFSAKLNSFGIDLKVGYFFTKQIRNRRKKV